MSGKVEVYRVFSKLEGRRERVWASKAEPSELLFGYSDVLHGPTDLETANAIVASIRVADQTSRDVPLSTGCLALTRKRRDRDEGSTGLPDVDSGLDPENAPYLP